MRLADESLKCVLPSFNRTCQQIILTHENLDNYQRDGCLLVPGLFSDEEVGTLRSHFMEMHDEAGYPGAENIDLESDDPLRRYPRIMMPHRYDETSLNWMIDQRLAECMRGMENSEPYAVQTMFYFKPAGAKGQALHQDQYYLRARPGTCMAAWMAVDRCDEETGCLRVVPGSHRFPVMCTDKADTDISFTDVEIPLPEGIEAVSVIMEPGDVLFFNGTLIHGSLPNSSPDRFRCALIGHYIIGNVEECSKGYHPVLRMDGSEITMGISEGGGPCGRWVEKDGTPVAEMAEME